MTSFYNDSELHDIGFRYIGKGVLLSRKTSIYSPEKIAIGNNVRIDDFCIISGDITLHNSIHIAAYCALFGGNTGIEIMDYAGISSRTVVYAESDDYTAIAFTNPTLPLEYRHIIKGKILLEKHAIIGTGCTVLPKVTIGEGAAIGSMSLISKSIEPWGIYVGVPCKRIKERDKEGILKLEQNYMNDSSIDKRH
jgi:galactoside O-acetyltransferase